MSSNIAEVAIPYAILALHDDKVDITAENISKVLVAAGIDVEPIWVQVFAKAFAGKDVGELLTRFTAGAAAAPTAGAAAPAAAEAAPAAGKAAKKEEKKEESDDDMGFGLFD